MSHNDVVNEFSGGKIHASDPFATPESDRSPVRRFRGRLAAAVPLGAPPRPAGRTVSSTTIAAGDPSRVLGLIDDESDFWDTVSQTRRFAVTPLTEADQQLADRFAGLMPAPGGLFAGGEWTETAYGPVPVTAGAWVGCTLDEDRPLGWSLLVEATITEVHVEQDTSPLLHYRGRYLKLSDFRSAHSDARSAQPMTGDQ